MQSGISRDKRYLARAPVERFNMLNRDWAKDIKVDSFSICSMSCIDKPTLMTSIVGTASATKTGV